MTAHRPIRSTPRTRGLILAAGLLAAVLQAGCATADAGGAGSVPARDAGAAKKPTGPSERPAY